jgi:Uma2 family endonuclease
MVEIQVPRWLAALDEKKPYIEVLDGEKLPDVSPYHGHGKLAGEIIMQLGPWAGDNGVVAPEVRFYFLHPDGRWSSLLPDVAYTSYARLPEEPIEEWERPRIAPDIAVEILSPSDRPGRTQRKVQTYLEFGARLVLVLHPVKRRVWLHRPDGSVEERDARGTWALTPFDDLTLDWDRIFRRRVQQH